MPETEDKLLATYRLMQLSRALDERCEDLLRNGVAVPHFHAGIGQEAASVAAVMPLQPHDAMIYTHRGYGSLLAKGVPLQTILRDMFMKEGGSNGGFGGVMHVSDPQRGVYGREGVFGTRFPISVGLAMAGRLQGENRVVLAFYGEAAGARGPLYEALNMAVLWNLPVVLVAENNGWSFSSRTEWLYPKGRMTRVWRGFDIPVIEVDGNDAREVLDVVSKAVERARDGGGPQLVEAMTYRVSPHIWYDDESYRDPDEVASRRQSDPLTRAHAQLREAGVEECVLSDARTGAIEMLDRAFEELAQDADATWPDEEPSVYHSMSNQTSRMDDA